MSIVLASVCFYHVKFMKETIAHGGCLESLENQTEPSALDGSHGWWLLLVLGCFLGLVYILQSDHVAF